ncbi:MAG: hypothetical protein KBE65_11770 [Phycisphaerae bacterium]|nr:hypothetical protein [Phycisphaerae bacterium]
MMDDGLLKESGPMLAQSSIVNHRSSMPRAFMLVEVLVVIVILPFAMIAINALFGDFIRDVPRMIRLVQQNTTVQNLLDQVRRDVDDATALPGQVGDTKADETSLLIERPEGVVCYRVTDGRVVRTLLGGQGGDERIWSARDAVIEWKPWTRGGNACAVEVHSYLKQRIHGHPMQKFVNAHVFFTHSLTAGGQIP